MKNNYFNLLYPLALAVFWLITWNIGNNDPVASSDAFAFLIHQNGIPWFIVTIVGVIFLAWTTWGAITQADLVTEYKWIPMASLIFCAASFIWFATVRWDAGHDVNVSAFFQQFMKK